MSEKVDACKRCGNLYDLGDERASKGAKLCPLCAIIVCRSYDMWAVWNDCNGVFEVTPRKAAADRLLDGPGYVRGRERVVPVRVFLEPEDDWWHREMQEAERG